MASSEVLGVKRMDLEISAAPRFFPYDARLGGYTLLVTEGPGDKVVAIKGPKAHVSVHHLKDLPTSARAPSKDS